MTYNLPVVVGLFEQIVVVDANAEMVVASKKDSYRKMYSFDFHRSCPNRFGTIAQILEKNSPFVVVKNGRELRLKHVQNIVFKISNERIDHVVQSN